MQPVGRGMRRIPLTTENLPMTKRPPVGRLICHRDAVWRVTAVTDSNLTDEERSVWIGAGMPPLGGWRYRPYQVELEHVGGHLPDGRPTIWRLDVRVAHTRNWGLYWHVYPATGRWPMCSCCGNPMPCKADRTDAYVETELGKIRSLEEHARKVLPGCCWACGEPITRRQEAVAYAGPNLDIPGGPAVTFHTRRKCHWKAHQYELKWLEEDPERHRILTWPECHGTLMVHADGTSECIDGEPDCLGHDSHDHRSAAACYCSRRQCTRGCTREGHRGTWTRPRTRRTADA